MESLPGAPDWLRVFRADERPDLWERQDAREAFRSVWPEYNQHGNHTGVYFGALVPRFAHLQALFVDDRDGKVVARGRTIPFCWDGSLDDLPSGIDALGLRAVNETKAPTALSALAAEVVPDMQGFALSGLVIRTMALLARSAGLGVLVAPVRPSRKHSYPLTAIERYAAWLRADGLPFDPWIRTHVRLGGTVLRCEPKSLEITAPVPSWESWTGMAFPEDGDYVFPDGLDPLTVRGDVGVYYEPNVWILHAVA